MQKAITKTDVEICKEAILEFRGNLDPKTVVDQVFEMISHEGFELVFIPNYLACNHFAKSIS